MEFIRQQLTGTIDAEKYHHIKQEINKLNDDVVSIKADVKKITNMMTKFIGIIPESFKVETNTSITPSVNSNVDGDNNNLMQGYSLIFEKAKMNDDKSNMMQTVVSSNSTENDIENTSQSKDELNEAMDTSMLNDSSLIFDETKNADELNVTVKSEDLSTSTIDMESTPQRNEVLNISMQGYIVEMVEVDVVESKGALDQTITTASQENSQFFESDSMLISSTQETAPTEEMTDTSDVNIQDKISELPIFMEENNSEEM